MGASAHFEPRRKSDGYRTRAAPRSKRHVSQLATA